jgi:hypothetical protein
MRSELATPTRQRVGAVRANQQSQGPLRVRRDQSHFETPSQIAAATSPLSQRLQKEQKALKNKALLIL